MGDRLVDQLLEREEEIAPALLDDARSLIPGLDDVEFEESNATPPLICVKLIERGLRDATNLADASFGTVRALALLAVLHDPEPPGLTCIEVVDLGVHPYLFDLVVDRLQDASDRTQFLVTTHSRALVNRLEPHELIVVERDPDGATRMPAVSADQIRNMLEAVDWNLGLGEIWFSGAMGGVPR